MKGAPYNVNVGQLLQQIHNYSKISLYFEFFKKIVPIQLNGVYNEGCVF